jgi:putative flippase GtrA
MKVSRIFAYIIVGIIGVCVLFTVFLLPYWVWGIIALVSVLKEFLDEKFYFSDKVNKWTKKVVGLHLSTIILLIYIIFFSIYWHIN